MNQSATEDLIRQGEHVAPSSVFQGGLCEKFTKRPPLTFQPNRVIYTLGDVARSVFYLQRGLVKLTALSEDGKEIILIMHRPGEIFGEFCLCGGMRSETAMTMESSDVVEIKFEELVKYIQEDQGAFYNLLIAVCERLSKAYQVIEELSFDELPDRLAKVLLRLASEYGNETDSGTELSCYITQEELAQMVSARREVVSAMLNRLREQGLIDYTRKSKMIIHQEELASYVEKKTGLENDAKTRRRTDHPFVGNGLSLMGRTQNWATAPSRIRNNRSLKKPAISG